MDTLLLSNSDVAKLIDLDEIYKSVESAFASFSEGNCVQPPIQNCVEPGTHNGFDFKCCLDMKAGMYSMKSSGYFADNIAKGIDPSMNTVTVYDMATGGMKCIMEANYIRNLRTAAGAAIANNYLSRKDAEVYFAFGTGRIGKAALRATMRIRNIKEVYCFGWLDGENDAFIAEMKKDFPNLVYHSCATPEEGARNADIIVSVTLARKGPAIMGEWLKPGTHITEIGVDTYGKQELDTSCFKNAKVVNDSTKNALDCGETRNAVEAGVIKPEDIYGEIGEIITGKKKGRENDQEITIYDTVGLAVMDLGMARALYEKAVKEGIGGHYEFI